MVVVLSSWMHFLQIDKKSYENVLQDRQITLLLRHTSLSRPLFEFKSVLTQFKMKETHKNVYHIDAINTPFSRGRFKLMERMSKMIDFQLENVGPIREKWR